MKTEKEKMLAGEVFNVYDPELVKERQYARQLVERFNALGEMTPTASNTVIRQLFGHVGENRRNRKPRICAFIGSRPEAERRCGVVSQTGKAPCRDYPGELQQGIWQGHHRDTQGRYHRRRRGVASRRPPRHWRHDACGIQPGEEVQSEEHLREFHHRTGSRESQRQG